MQYNTIIIGCGISGISAAIYLKRANLEIAIFENNAPGGQLLRTSIVENYPGVKQTGGAALAVELYEQINKLDVPVYFENIEEIKKTNNAFEIKTKEKTITCQNIIFATGRTQKKLGLPKEEELTGKGISYCATCDGPLYKEKEVVVIGAGNSAFEEALYLSNFCKKVTILARKEEYRADRTLIEKVSKKENIEIRSNKIVTDLIGNEKLEAIKTLDKLTNKEEIIPCEGAFIYIGQIPTTNLSEQLSIEKENGYIITNEKMETNIEGVYACGDCRYKEVYQLVTATYDGVIAATEIIRKKDTSSN